MSQENHHEDLVKALNELVLEPSNPEKAKAITNNPISLVIHNLRHSENLISQLQDVLDEKTKSDSLDGISEISLLAQDRFSETEKTDSAIITLRAWRFVWAIKHEFAAALTQEKYQQR